MQLKRVNKNNKQTKTKGRKQDLAHLGTLFGSAQKKELFVNYSATQIGGVAGLPNIAGSPC